MTPALSAAGAICDHVRDWLLGSRRGDWVSMGVASDGSYGVPPGLFFSFPVTCQHGSWQIVQVCTCMLSATPSCIEQCCCIHSWHNRMDDAVVGLILRFRLLLQGLEIDDRMREDLEGCVGQLEAERELI